MDDNHIASIRLPKMNREYQWNLTEEISELKPGMRYTCSVTVGLNKIEVVTDEEPLVIGGMAVIMKWPEVKT